MGHEKGSAQLLGLTCRLSLFKTIASTSAETTAGEGGTAGEKRRNRTSFLKLTAPHSHFCPGWKKKNERLGGQGVEREG